MENETFNPFEDRFSRDMRNAMSSALATAIETGETTELTSVVASYRKQDLAPHYRNYLEVRYERFTLALDSIHVEQEPIEQAVILWNQKLYFEVHEVLEHAWYDAGGNYKLLLQALIRAAGTYVKLECGYTEVAKKIAGKSWPVLQENENLLSNYFNPAPLIEALKNPVLEAPTLTPTNTQ
ncbi:DUF309 domain-containing protein [Desulforhopalus sp. 52FAK]